MFTGIIQNLGSLTDAAEVGGGKRIRVATGWRDLERGESVAINGTCLTVEEFTPSGDCVFFLSAETLNKTSLKSAAPGRKVNLERALTLQTRLSGHLVQGHVDGLAMVTAIEENGDSHRLWLEVQREQARYCVTKGSIAIDGISLTINHIENLPYGRARLDFMIIPHTWANTTLFQTSVGDEVNIEVDVMAKYAERLCQPYLKQ